MLKDYQKRIDSQLQSLAKPYWHPLSQLARISEEVGELARILNHQFGDKPKKQNEQHHELSEELADILYSIICLANSQNIDLDKALEKSIAKLSTRDQDRFVKK